MKLILDSDAKTLTVQEDGSSRTLDLYSTEAFEALSQEWLRIGWNQKYTYTFSWMGRPVIQLPEDLIRTQEVIHQLRHDLIIETGVAHGGSLIFYASLCQAMDHGSVIGVDIEIRPANRAAIEAHPLFHRISLIEGSSTAPETIRAVQEQAKSSRCTLIFLDSDHSYAHVLAELEAYGELVSIGSYIVATDGIMADLADVPRGDSRWRTDNPTATARDFAAANPAFQIEQPPWPFNESALSRNVTHFPGAWLKRVS